MTTIVVEVKHSKETKAWLAYSDKEIISAARCDSNGEGRLRFEEWTLDDACEIFGEVDEIPEDLADILKSGKAIEVGDYNDSKYCSESDAGTEIEAAKEVIADDLYACGFLTVSEAKSLVAEDGGIYGIKACVEVKKLLCTFNL